MFQATLLAKRDLLFEVIAQSELSELCVFHNCGERKMFFFLLISHVWKASATELWDSSAELLNIIESLSRVLRSKPKLERKRRTNEFSGTGSCSEGFSYWTLLFVQ